MLILLALLTQDAGCFPHTGDRLVADDIEIRDAAVADLIKRGPKAVPTIRRALEKATDSELKGRLEEALRALTEVRWLTDLNTALKRAKDESKPLFVFASRARQGGWS